MRSLKYSICMPVYNGEGVIKETLCHILSQSFSDFEIIVTDDNSSDNTLGEVSSFNDKRIKIFKNEINLGYSRNLEACRRRCSNEIIFLMGQDDILAKDALLKTCKAFEDDEVGAVTRPYYWFYEDIKKPVRAKSVYSLEKDAVISINDSLESVVKVFRSLDQLSGLAFRRSFMHEPFHEDVFTSHVWPFAAIFKEHKIVYLKDYTIAVRILTSQTRSVSAIYKKSPMQSWKEMFDTVYREERFKTLRSYCIKNFVAKNYVGLAQIKNYSKLRYLVREIFLLIRYRWVNIFDLRFWAFALGALVMPRKLLIFLVDSFKNKVLSKRLSHIRFDVS
jgi:glycosyltransferase involved in cell wall biosynthesis